MFWQQAYKLVRLTKSLEEDLNLRSLDEPKSISIESKISESCSFDAIFVEGECFESVIGSLDQLIL